MHIELHLFASLAEYLPDHEKGNPNVLELPAGTSIGELIDLLKIPSEAPRIIFRNGIHADREAVLMDGDRVGMFPPLAGG
ncbi:MAG: MoaD/ThiS family protein [Desulfobacterota bacterium]|nr:MoaD/ThiS family protein [Thermodesulfobacteriota bacterium]